MAVRRFSANAKKQSEREITWWVHLSSDLKTKALDVSAAASSMEGTEDEVAQGADKIE
jgi:hypothetical protein